MPTAIKTNRTLRTQGFAVEYYPRYVNRKAKPHSLNVVLLSCILRGHGHHIIEDETFEEHGNSVAVTHYEQRHDIVTDAVGMDVINLYLNLQEHPIPILPLELQEVLPLFLPLHPKFVNRLNRVVRIEFENLEPMGELLFGIQREQAERGPGHEEAAAMYLRLFLIECCRRVLKKGLARPASDHSSVLGRLERVRRKLDENYAETHTLSQLAKLAGMSRTYLCRAFKRHTGRRVFDYLIERRVQAAMMRLRGTSEKVASVALESGFSDLAHFNRKFRRLVGMTPSAYREQYRSA